MIPAGTPRQQLPGFNVVGHVTGNLGLAVPARNTLRVLDQNSVPFTAIDVDPGGGRGGQEAAYAAHIKSPPEAPYATNLFQLNPTEVIALAQEPPEWLDLAGRFNACVPFWELPRLPAKLGWIPLLETVDLVLAPSRFVLEAVRTSAPSATVWHYPQAVFLPEGVGPNRDRFALPADKVLFYMSLDVTSDTTRKNPQAALEAFTQSFGDRDDARLVIKLNNTTAYGWASDAARQIRDLISDNPNVIVIDQAMSYSEVQSLSASCDIYLSLHRSEGLGLNLLEAMSMGKPVIATAWSGNMDFMTPENSCLVDYELIPVVAEHAAYQPDVIGPGQVWADPKVDVAAQWMRRLVQEPDLRRSIAVRASADMEELRARFVQPEVFDRMAKASAETLGAQTRHDREMRWTRLRRRSLPLHIRRLGGRLLRRLGLRR